MEKDIKKLAMKKEAKNNVNEEIKKKIIERNQDKAIYNSDMKLI